MLKLTTNKSANHLLRKKDRTLSDYLKLFNTRNFYEENTEIPSIPNEGYKRLYNLNKLNKEKEEDYRQKMIKLRELNELTECSFIPKINKDFENKKENIFNNIYNQNLFTEKSSFSSKNKGKSEEMSDLIISDLLKRQEEWIRKKNQKMELNKQIQKNQVNKKLIFSPEINKINLDFMKIDAQEIVADPESYKDYIDRNKKKILDFGTNNNSTNKIRNTWNKNNYDYTEHKLIFRNNKNSKSLDMKKQIRGKNMIYSKTKINSINNGGIYSLIYLENKEKYENKINEGFSEQEKKKYF